MAGPRPSTAKLVKEALGQGPRCVWEVYQYVKSRPAHYKRGHVTYRSVYNMVYVLRRLGLIRRLPGREVEGGKPRPEGPSTKRIRPKYARAYYVLVDPESEAWNNPYKAYSTMHVRKSPTTASFDF